MNKMNEVKRLWTSRPLGNVDKLYNLVGLFVWEPKMKGRKLNNLILAIEEYQSTKEYQRSLKIQKIKSKL